MIDPLHDRKGGMAREKRTIRYDDDVWELLEARSKATGRAMTTIVNDALRNYLTQSEDDLEARMAALEARVAAIESKLGSPLQ